MTRDETVALFLECEARRAEAHAAAMARGLPKSFAEREGQAAARKRWNEWSNRPLTELKANAGEEAKTDCEVDFSRCHFIAREPNEAAEGKLEVTDPTVRLIVIDSDAINFSGFAFPGTAFFDKTAFEVDARFDHATFSGSTSFFRTRFGGKSSFYGVTFDSAASFEGAKFEQRTTFMLAAFKGSCIFANASFKAAASFEAIQVDRSFDMWNTTFSAIPDFSQAHFLEAPNLDRVVVHGHADSAAADDLPRWLLPIRHALFRIIIGFRKDSTERDLPSRWRALKRLAIQGHDTDRELEYHSREMRSRRFAGDWPLPLAFWRGDAWMAFFRFWFGIFYEIASNFGQSVARPFAFWSAAVALGTVFYISQSPEMVVQRTKMEQKGASQISAALATAWHAWWWHPRPCYAGNPQPEGANPPPYIGALSSGLQDGTGVANEAWHLAFRNAFIVLDGSNEAAHRTYGCLYGVEMYGGSNPIAVVPSAVSTVSAIQKLFSGLMIFLFGLALRNMLKVK